jgi:hypothetical protein
MFRPRKTFGKNTRILIPILHQGLGSLRFGMIMLDEEDDVVSLYAARSRKAFYYI